MLFPGDIISIKVKAGDGMKGGILWYITYVDEDKKTTKLTTNKEQWVCDKAVPGEEKKTDSSLIKEEGAQWIWGPTYQQETVCEVQIPCKGKKATTTQPKTRTTRRRRVVRSVVHKSIAPPKKEEPKVRTVVSKKTIVGPGLPKPRTQPAKPTTPTVKKVTRKTTVTPTPAVRRSSSSHLEHAVNPGNAKKYFCMAKNRFIPYREERGAHYCLKSAKNNLCHYHKSMEDCLNFIKSTAITKNEKPYRLKFH